MTDTPMMQVPVPSVEELELDKLLISGRTAKELVGRRQALKQGIEAAEQEIKDIDDELGIGLDLREVKTATCGEWLLIRRTGSKPRPMLDRVLLMEAGVTPQQLEAGTKFSEKGKPGITIQSVSKTSARRYAQDESDLS